MIITNQKCFLSPTFVTKLKALKPILRHCLHGFFFSSLYRLRPEHSKYARFGYHVILDTFMQKRKVAKTR